MFYIDNELNTKDKYDLIKFIEVDDNLVFNTLNSYFLYSIPKLPISNYYVVKTEANRPDLLSFSIYGDTQYWWILMVYNNILKPQDITVGKIIKYASLGSIENLYRNASLYKKVR